MIYAKEPPKRTTYESINTLIQPKNKGSVLPTYEPIMKEQGKKGPPQEIAEHQNISSAQNKDQLEDPNKNYLRNYYQNEFRFLIDFIPKEQYNALVERYVNNYPSDYLKYNGGVFVGLGEGIFIGAKNAILAVADLVKLIVNLEVEYLKFLGKEVPKVPGTLWEGLKFIQSEIGEHISDPNKAVKDDMAYLNNAGALAKEIGGLIASVPGMIPELFKEGKKLIYGEISKSLRKWAAKGAFDQGKDVGSLTGQIVFEVIIALIGTKGTDKIAKLAEGNKLGIILKSPELEKVAQAVEKLNAVKSRLNGLLEGTKYADVIKLLAERKSQLIQKAVKEILQDAAKKGLKEVTNEVAEQAIRKVVKESLSELEKETGKRISKEVLEDITEKSVGEVKKEVVGKAGQLEQLVTDKFGLGREISAIQEISKKLGTGKVGDFSGLEGTTIEDILSRIPKNAIRRELRPIEGGALEGFEYKWVQDNQTWRVRVHGPDKGAPKGSNASNGWIVRVQKGKQYMDSDGEFHPPGVSNLDSPFYNEKVINDTHIPISVPKIKK